MEVLNCIDLFFYWIGPVNVEVIESAYVVYHKWNLKLLFYIILHQSRIRKEGRVNYYCKQLVIDL